MTDTNDAWYGPDRATFGDRVAAAREAANMTQKDLAKRLGIKLSTLESWEADTSEPRANRLSMMAGLLNVSMMWLLNGDGEGVDAPEDETEMPEGLDEILADIREARETFRKSAAHMGRLEKRLRTLMQDANQ
ncbi:helix-turn-helix domain-containing protein [Primorskyibacter flagellatus]|uniref:Helix-turn-helix n=1 Tax=Primorskyibacter flagellatus TaxID=1387277 RepID=A0A1W2E4J4_9RHOB|nr:helix-turn-helix domain-containing protein [Primorskyibacter flagellatus]SMD04660.1 Helix-turn-helix [Primorskyibacter flagellatus]